MRRNLFLVTASFVLTLPIAAQQEFVYGDPETKKFYNINCSEAAAIKKGTAVGFAKPKKAEEAGYTRGETCTAKAAAVVPTVPTPGSTGGTRSSANTASFDTRNSTSIEQMETGFHRLKGRTQTFVGEIEISDVFIDEFENYRNGWWEFRLLDYSDHGYFFIRKSQHSNAIRELIATKNRDREFELIWECQVIPKGIFIFSNAKQVWGEIVKCQAAQNR